MATLRRRNISEDDFNLHNIGLFIAAMDPMTKFSLLPTEIILYIEKFLYSYLVLSFILPTPEMFEKKRPDWIPKGFACRRWRMKSYIRNLGGKNLYFDDQWNLWITVWLLHDSQIRLVELDQRAPFAVKHFFSMLYTQCLDKYPGFYNRIWIVTSKAISPYEHDSHRIFVKPCGVHCWSSTGCEAKAKKLVREYRSEARTLRASVANMYKWNSQKN